MNLLHVYNLLNTGEITHAQAAKALGFSERSLTFRLSRYGNRLPLVLATLDQIKANKISRDEAAEKLEISTRHVNKLMESWSVVRPVDAAPEHMVGRVESKVKWEVRTKYAADFIEGTLSLDMAAEAASCDGRTIRRWAGALLDKHFSMGWKDLAAYDLPQRRRIAQEIRTAEGLEKDKQRMIDSIAAGTMTMKDEAINRVLAKRSITKANRKTE